MDCSQPGSSVHGIILARILDWVATFSSRGTSQPRDRTCVSCIGRRILYFQATREVPTFISLYYMNIHCFSVLAAQQIYLKIWHLGPTLTDQESTALGTRHSCFLYSFLSGPVAQLRLRSKELQCDRLLANSVVFFPLISALFPQSYSILPSWQKFYLIIGFATDIYFLLTCWKLSHIQRTRPRSWTRITVTEKWVTRCFTAPLPMLSDTH